MALSKATELPKQFIVEYKNDDGKLEARWHYDRSITTKGPYLIENFNLPRKEKVAKNKKQ